jgi:F0F1-type ATP synthase assembly protein I
MFIDPASSKDMARYMALTQVGLEIIAPAVLGWLLDSQMGWGPWGLIVGAVLGFTGGLFHLVHLANKANEDENKTRNQPPRPNGSPREPGQP